VVTPYNCHPVPFGQNPRINLGSGDTLFPALHASVQRKRFLSPTQNLLVEGKIFLVVRIFCANVYQDHADKSAAQSTRQPLPVDIELSMRPLSMRPLPLPPSPATQRLSALLEELEHSALQLRKAEAEIERLSAENRKREGQTEELARFRTEVGLSSMHASGDNFASLQIDAH